MSIVCTAGPEKTAVKIRKNSYWNIYLKYVYLKPTFFKDVEYRVEILRTELSIDIFKLFIYNLTCPKSNIGKY